MTMTAEEYRNKFASKSPKNKLRNKKTEYNGEIYDSKKEAEYAMILDARKLLPKSDPNHVVAYERQIKYVIEINDVKICSYILDFKVGYQDRIEHVDIKGYKGGATYSVFRLKKKLMKGFFGIEVIEK